MGNIVIDTLAKLWDAQVKPKNECKTFQEKIDRIEERHSGRVVRAVIAGVLATPLICTPVISTLVSAFQNVSVKNDDVINQGMRAVPQVHQAQTTMSFEDDILLSLGKGISLALGMGLAGFALKRATDAKRDGNIIIQLKLDQESRDHQKGNTPS